MYLRNFAAILLNFGAILFIFDALFLIFDAILYHFDAILLFLPQMLLIFAANASHFCRQYFLFLTPHFSFLPPDFPTILHRFCILTSSLASSCGYLLCMCSFNLHRRKQCCGSDSACSSCLFSSKTGSDMFDIKAVIQFFANVCTSWSGPFRCW